MIRNKFTLTQSKERLKACLRTLPRTLGVEAVRFFDDSFKAQGFTDAVLVPWRRTKSGKANRFGQRSDGILIGRGRLRRGTRLMSAGGMSATVVNATPYAQAHNEGFRGVVSVPAYTRRVTTFVYERKSRKRKKAGHRDITIKAHSRRMNLPRRQFMGRSRVLTEQHRQTILKTIYEAFK